MDEKQKEYEVVEASLIPISEQLDAIIEDMQQHEISDPIDICNTKQLQYTFISSLEDKLKQAASNIRMSLSALSHFIDGHDWILQHSSDDEVKNLRELILVSCEAREILTLYRKEHDLEYEPSMMNGSRFVPHIVLIDEIKELLEKL